MKVDSDPEVPLRGRVSPQLQLIDKVLVLRFDQLQDGFFGALHTGAGPGVVSTRTRPP